MTTTAIPDTTAPTVAHPFQSDFEHAIETSGLGDPAWLLPARRAGIEAFARAGWPTLKDEDYRFTNLAPLARTRWEPALWPQTTASDLALPPNLPFLGLPGLHLVFVNGGYCAELSRHQALPAGITATPISALSGVGEAAFRSHFGRHIQGENDPFVGLNTAFFRDGAFIHAQAGAAIESPIHLIFLTSASGTAPTVFPRVLIVAEKGSRLTVVESHVSLCDGPSLSVPVVEIAARESARIEHLKFQDESLQAFHLSSVHGHFGVASQSIVHSFVLGGALSRNNLRVCLDGEGQETVLNGLYLTRDEQLADHHMVVEHASPHCASHEYFNGILNGRSRGVFHGRILVRSVAQKTDAKQTNKNLLLSDDAVVNTKPQLEIYADDVKCTHGATIGQMNPESVFYLRSRGIGLDNARRILMHAFAGEIIDRIRHDGLRNELDQRVWDRLERNARAHV